MYKVADREGKRGGNRSKASIKGKYLHSVFTCITYRNSEVRKFKSASWKWKKMKRFIQRLIFDTPCCDSALSTFGLRDIMTKSS